MSKTECRIRSSSVIRLSSFVFRHSSFPVVGPEGLEP
jgi:hypothetical protein